MNLVGIENITPYEGVFEFSLYKYEDEINLGDKESFVCDLRVILTKVQESYIQRINKSVVALVLVENLNLKSDKLAIEESVKEFIFQEVYEENLTKENIEVMFIEKPISK